MKSSDCNDFLSLLNLSSISVTCILYIPFLPTGFLTVYFLLCEVSRVYRAAEDKYIYRVCTRAGGIGQLLILQRS